MLEQLALRGSPVALIVSDQRMPQMTGVQFLEHAKEHCPDAKLVLLTAYADTDAAIKAINDIGLDHYLMKPWDPPEERLYPALDELLDDWRDANRDDPNAVRVIGHRWSEHSHELRSFLARNHVQYTWFDIERDDEARRLQELAQAARSRSAARARARQATCCAHRRRSKSRRRSVCARARRTCSMTSASSVPAPPGSRPRCTAHPRGCARSSSSATRRADKRGRARPSRTISASRRGCRVPIWPTAPSRK